MKNDGIFRWNSLQIFFFSANITTMFHTSQFFYFFEHCFGMSNRLENISIKGCNNCLCSSSNILIFSAKFVPSCSPLLCTSFTFPFFTRFKALGFFNTFLWNKSPSYSQCNSSLSWHILCNYWKYLFPLSKFIL